MNMQIGIILCATFVISFIAIWIGVAFKSTFNMVVGHFGLIVVLATLIAIILDELQKKRR